jgi:chromate transporter
VGVPLLELARAWVIVATQSVGGGPATLLLISRHMVDREGWLTRRQFLEDYALSKMSVGINLITLSGLIGSRVAGVRGIAVSLLAFVVPAAMITVALTVGYVSVRDSALVRAALSGAGPVTAGMTAGFGLTMARQAARSGRRALLDWAVAVATFALSMAFSPSPLAILLIGAIVGAFLLRGEPARASGERAP